MAELLQDMAEFFRDMADIFSGMDDLGRVIRSDLASDLTRRALLQRAGALGLAAAVTSALPAARLLDAAVAEAADPNFTDATLQAYFDTIIPGRRAARTDLGNPIHPQAIAGVDREAGAVEADALLLAKHPRIGFETLAPALLSEIEALALPRGGTFLSLGYAERYAVCEQGLAYDQPTRVVWEAGAAVPFTAFCAAATQRNATSRTASGLRVMGHPGTAPHGYRDFSYRRRLARGRTRGGSLS
jgi:hypothetical protein